MFLFSVYIVCDQKKEGSCCFVLPFGVLLQQLQAIYHVFNVLKIISKKKGQNK